MLRAERDGGAATGIIAVRAQSVGCATSGAVETKVSSACGPLIAALFIGCAHANRVAPASPICSMHTTQSSKPIEIKISTVVAVSAILRVLDLPTLDAAMRSMTGGASDYFDNEFAVLDVTACDFSVVIDWMALTTFFKAYRLNPVAVRGAPVTMEAEIIASGLSIDTMVQPRQERRIVENAAVASEMAALPITAPPSSSQSPANTMIVDTPVRAGQRIYARGADLVVMAAVNNGAELIADGSIHVYAPLRGRALAGASGNTASRIFALSMEAELVSIAGVYRTFDGGLPAELSKKAVQVKLVGDRIDLAPIRT